MKTIHHLLLFAGLTASVCAAGAAPAPDETPTNAPGGLADTKAAPASPQPAAPASPAENAGARPPAPTAWPPQRPRWNRQCGLSKAPTACGSTSITPRLTVLDYLSDAAGFIINKEADVRGTLDVQGKDLTREEAVEVLNSALKKNGYAVIRNPGAS